MLIQKQISLKNYSSFHCGGNAENLVRCENYKNLQRMVEETALQPITVLGFGTNVLISDKGLPGLTIVARDGDIALQGNTLIAGAGVWWDDLVQLAISHGLWGIELMSGIPSSVGGAIMGNIAAYGQQTSDTLTWVDVIDRKTKKMQRIDAKNYEYSYRYNSLQKQPNLVILRAGFTLKEKPVKKLEYGSALRVAEELGLDPEGLTDRREIIMEARKRAGSLYDPNKARNTYTAGSFFKNPIVTAEIAKSVIKFDETGKPAELLLKQNQVHGGSDYRVSAAHVLLAAGFERGQTWGNVRLHPEHILKVENTGKATAQEIYDVGQILIKTVQGKLGVTLEPEVKFLGNFTK